MISIFQILLVAFSLAMDAFSVSIVGGINSQRFKLMNVVKVALFFGVFQACMPLVGWVVGQTLDNFIKAIDHWLAFILLAFIGIKMIRESFNDINGKSTDILNNKTLLVLSIATSIDALAVGITLDIFETPILVSVSVIGIITFILCFLGFLFGKKLGVLFGKRIEIFGGLVLFFIGIKILIEHLI